MLSVYLGTYQISGSIQFQLLFTIQFWFRFPTVKIGIIKPNDFTYLFRWLLICSVLDSNQYQMKLMTPLTQMSVCPSQTSSVPKLLSAHSDGVVDSTPLPMCHTIISRPTPRYTSMVSFAEIYKISRLY